MTVFILLYLITASFSLTTNGERITKTVNGKNLITFWRFKYIEPIFNGIIPGNKVIVNQNNIQCFKKNSCYGVLEKYFSNCSSPYDFFNQMNSIKDAFRTEQGRTVTLRDSTLKTLCDALENGTCSMCCVQQVLILMYGILARFGHYSSTMDNIIVEFPYGDFSIEIWRAFDLNFPIYPWRSHHMIVIDVWNGQDEFILENETIDKILIDPWVDRFIEWNIRDIFLFFRPKFSFHLFTETI